MTREIKFRGYDGADWIYGSAVLCDNDNWYMIENGGPDDDWVMVGKVGQYTNLKDSKGVEIYEGDILDFGYIVTYVDGSQGADLGMNVGFYEQRDNFESWAQLEVGLEYEVKGNIYESEEQS